MKKKRSSQEIATDIYNTAVKNFNELTRKSILGEELTDRQKELHTYCKTYVEALESRNEGATYRPCLLMYKFFGFNGAKKRALAERIKQLARNFYNKCLTSKPKKITSVVSPKNQILIAF